MEKKTERMKTVQLILTVTIAVFSLVIIFTDSELYQAIGHNPSVRILCVMLWLAELLSFVSIFFDYKWISSSKRDYRELDYTVYNDHVAGIANRYSCDTIINKYADKELPDTIGCIMLEISNINEINQSYGHTRGNMVIQDFSDILHNASVSLCFVGRNGGNKFMALFEDCTEAKMNIFLGRLAQKVEIHNQQDDVPQIKYKSGQAFHEGNEITTITQLIALANRRITGKTDTVTGIPNRDSCDDIINQYVDKPLQDDIGCIMLNLTNLVEINTQHSRGEGNRLLRCFSDILRDASLGGICFVGRNGGSTFLAIFEQCTQEKMDLFISRTNEEIDRHNSNPNNTKIHCSWGAAFHEENVTTINQLLALANARIRDNER